MTILDFDKIMMRSEIRWQLSQTRNKWITGEELNAYLLENGYKDLLTVERNKPTRNLSEFLRKIAKPLLRQVRK